MDQLGEQLAALDRQKQQLDQQPLSGASQESVTRHIQLKTIHDTLAIEGSPLSVIEIKLIIEDGLAPGGRHISQLLQVLNQAEALTFIQTLARREQTLAEADLMKLHAILCNRLTGQESGQYRQHNIRIRDAEYIPPEHGEIAQQVDELLTWLADDDRDLHPVLKAAELQARYYRIMPFAMHNGLMGRLLTAYQLKRVGYPIACPSSEAKKDYLASIDEASVTGKHGRLAFHNVNAVLENLHTCLHLASPQTHPVPASLPE